MLYENPRVIARRKVLGARLVNTVYTICPRCGVLGIAPLKRAELARCIECWRCRDDSGEKVCMEVLSYEKAEEILYQRLSELNEIYTKFTNYKDFVKELMRRNTDCDPIETSFGLSFIGYIVVRLLRETRTLYIYIDYLDNLDLIEKLVNKAIEVLGKHLKAVVIEINTPRCRVPKEKLLELGFTEPLSQENWELITKIFRLVNTAPSTMNYIKYIELNPHLKLLHIV